MFQSACANVTIKELNPFCLTSEKWDIGKQCRSRSGRRRTRRLIRMYTFALNIRISSKQIIKMNIIRHPFNWKWICAKRDVDQATEHFWTEACSSQWHCAIHMFFINFISSQCSDLVLLSMFNRETRKLLLPLHLLIDYIFKIKFYFKQLNYWNSES